jgi:predicted site-specific integrase-resolvase
MTRLAPRDVARRLNLSTSRIVQLDREGVVRAMRDSAGRRICAEESVEAYARAREQRRSCTSSPIAVENDRETAPQRLARRGDRRGGS